ncbi:MAG: dihydrodipicolinate synthase family protein [Lachnospiraceae bacterium]|nr:dihydrodipicolinate synthase family protein [Lachnospiraceae bacterium]
MRDIAKYQGILPAFYACYDREGEISPEAVRKLTEYFVEKGVKGVYVGGSSGECIYHSVAERKLVLENVMEAAQGRLTVIAHVGCNSTRDSVELARHAESLGVDAIASIPPIYFHLPDDSIADYWNAMSDAAPNTDFVIYNIPQLAGVSLTMPLFRKMLENPRVVAVKNSSMPVQDIQMFLDEGTRGGRPFIVFNGPDEQLISGLAMGAGGGIGGTYAVMPELILKVWNLMKTGEVEKARKVQFDIDNIIYAMCDCKGNMYAAAKEILRRRTGIDVGGVRAPLSDLVPEDMPKIAACVALIDEAMARWAD